MISVYLLLDFCVCGMFCYVFFILLLPCDNLVNDVLLLTCSPAKIYTSVSMLSCPIKSAKSDMSLNFSKKFLAYL